MGDSRSQTGSLMLSSQVCVYHRRGQTGIHLLRRKPGLLPGGVEAVGDALQERKDADERQRASEGLLRLLGKSSRRGQRAGGRSDELALVGYPAVVKAERPRRGAGDGEGRESYIVHDFRVVVYRRL